MRKPTNGLIHLLNCWWFAINFRWRSSLILFRFCRFSFLWCPLSQSHCRRFNFFFCRSLKIAQRFSIVNNCLKERNKTKEHEIKTGTKNSTEQRKTKFLTIRYTKFSRGSKGPIFDGNWLYRLLDSADWVYHDALYLVAL